MNPWRIPVLFLIAGITAGYLLQNRPVGKLLTSRLMRLVPPLVFTSLFIAPVSPWLFEKFHGREPYYLPNPSHLWFVMNLTVYFVFALPLFWYLKRHPDNLILRVWRLASPFGWLLILPFVLTATSLVLEPYIGPEMFATHVIRFWHGFACFVCGIILVSLGEQFWQGIRRICHVALPVALVLYLLRMTEIGFESQPVAMAMRTTESACGMLAVLGYGGIFFNQPSRIFSVLNRAVFAVYIVHLPVQQIVAYYLFRSEMNTWLAFALHLLATLGISYLLYAMLLPIRWLHPFFGIAPVKAKHSGANPSAEKTPRQPSWPSIAGRFATLYVLSPLIVLAVSIGVFASMLFNVAGTLDGTDKAIEASVGRFRSEIAMRSPDENYHEAQGLFASLVQALESRNIDRARILVVEIELIAEGLSGNGESESEVEGVVRRITLNRQMTEISNRKKPKMIFVLKSSLARLTKTVLILEQHHHTAQ